MTETAMTTQARTDTDAGEGFAKAVVAGLLYYTPVTILSLSQLDLPRALMMAFYLLPFVVVPLLGLWRLASSSALTGRTLATAS